MADPKKTNTPELTAPPDEPELPAPPEAAEKALPSAEHLKLVRGKAKQILKGNPA